MRSVVILVIKNRTTAHGYYSYDYRPNWTLLSPITITDFSLSKYPFLSRLAGDITERKDIEAHRLHAI